MLPNKMFLRPDKNVAWNSWVVGWTRDYDGDWVVHVGPLKVFSLYTPQKRFHIKREVIVVWLSRTCKTRIIFVVNPQNFVLGFVHIQRNPRLSLGFFDLELQIIDKKVGTSWPPGMATLFGYWSKLR